MPSRQWRDWFGSGGESERVVFRTIDHILEERFKERNEVTKSEILEGFRRQPDIVRAFHEHGLSITDDADGRDTSRNMVDWFDSRYSRWQEHERFFSKLTRNDHAGQFVYSRKAEHHA
ncbi:MAG: hypothetical protein JRN67_07730 [Nitrososphaerota archaeon]|nr:hypothetical protein [Nitrososphaerota archaeon]